MLQQSFLQPRTLWQPLIKYNNIEMNYFSVVVDDVSHYKKSFAMTIEIELQPSIFFGVTEILLETQPSYACAVRMGRGMLA